ncbi:lipocalin family protein [Vampirovibrio chlorellavorus]|uniref:lipocalin family protein n=1 Tax=Vampirovibrio chlorellavorus TaxID=758823 RepID=UPI0026EFABA8|nr:lipocalin family protein [Vampirovibrio chlorellavorus]
MKKRVYHTTLFGLGLTLLGLVNGLFWGNSLPAHAKTPAPPTTVAHVDLEKYTGKWYEIAAIPMFFERKCVGNTTAEYTRLASGEVSVFNSCQLSNGKRQSATGLARVVDPKTNAKLKVSFLNLPLFGWQFWASGDYWIIDLADDYSTALIGHPTRKYGWILSRTPELPTETLKGLSKKLADQGYNPCDFITMPQTGGFSQKQPLCVAVSPTAK